MNLSHANLIETTIKAADFSHANLSDAALSYLDDVNLSHANLLNGKLGGAYISNAQLVNTNMTQCSLYGACISGSLLNRVDLSFAEMYDTSIQNSIVIQPELKGADLDRIQVGNSLLDIDWNGINVDELHVDSRCTLTLESAASAARNHGANLLWRLGYGTNSEGYYEPIKGVLILPGRTSGFRHVEEAAEFIQLLKSRIADWGPVWVEHNNGAYHRQSMHQYNLKFHPKDTLAILVRNNCVGGLSSEECNEIVHIEEALGRRIAYCFAIDDIWGTSAEKPEYRRFFADREVHRLNLDNNKDWDSRVDAFYNDMLIQ